MIETLKSRLISPPPRLLLWQGDRVDLAADGTGPTFVVIARRYCRFRAFQRVAAQEGPKERAALNLKIQDWLPYRPSGHISITTPKHQLVWAWDKAKADLMLRAQGLNPRRVTFVPETLMMAPAINEIRLTKCMDGFEGQIWVDKVLIETRWWPESPNAQEWVAFQRGAGTKPDQMLANTPKPMAQAWLARPWGNDRNSLAAIITSFEPRDLAAAAIFTLALPFLYLASAGIKTQLLAGDTNDRIAKLEATAAPVLSAQTAALSGIAQIKSLSALDPYPAQISVMAKVAALMPKDGARFVEWSYQAGDLEVGIQSTAPIDARTYVQQFEASGAFKDVSVDRSNPLISKLKMKVLQRDAVTNPANAAPADPNLGLPPVLQGMIKAPNPGAIQAAPAPNAAPALPFGIQPGPAAGASSPPPGLPPGLLPGAAPGAPAAGGVPENSPFYIKPGTVLKLPPPDQLNPPPPK